MGNGVTCMLLAAIVKMYYLLNASRVEITTMAACLQAPPRGYSQRGVSMTLHRSVTSFPALLSPPGSPWGGVDRTQGTEPRPGFLKDKETLPQASEDLYVEALGSSGPWEHTGSCRPHLGTQTIPGNPRKQMSRSTSHLKHQSPSKCQPFNSLPLEGS